MIGLQRVSPTSCDTDTQYVSRAMARAREHENDHPSFTADELIYLWVSVASNACMQNNAVQKPALE